MDSNSVSFDPPLEYYLLKLVFEIETGTQDEQQQKKQEYKSTSGSAGTIMRVFISDPVAFIQLVDKTTQFRGGR